MKYQRNASVESAPLTDETLLYEPKSVKFCALNETGAYLWERLATPRSASELLDDLRARYSVENRALVQQELQGFLDEFVRLSFVAMDPAPNGHAASVANGHPEASPSGAPYASPRIRVMDESEVLTAFQVTSAGITWWMM